MFNLRNKSSNPTCDGHFFSFYFRGRNKKVPCGICKKEFRSDKLKTHREVCKKKIPVAKPPKGQRKKETCKFCKKKFERIKKHVCLSKRKYKPSKNDVDDIKKYFKNKKKNPFIESRLIFPLRPSQYLMMMTLVYTRATTISSMTTLKLSTIRVYTNEKTTMRSENAYGIWATPSRQTIR